MAALTQQQIDEAKNLDEADKKKLVRELGGTFKGVTDQATLGRLYLSLLGVLAVIAILCGLAAFVLFGAGRESAAVFMGVVTTIVGALVGLFAPSPVGERTENNT